ncbi:MAG: hypothetical protein R3277_12665 [Brumimicrobium sp.]|nr:hypothetical protein [Brumimicrobium sp.]
MKWIGERISFVDHKEYVTFVIYPPNIGNKKYLILIWSLAWLAIGAYVFTQFFYDYSEKEKIVLIIFMSFWVYFAVKVFRTLLYLFFGREFIKIDKTALRLKTATSNYGQARQFFLENITKFSVLSLKDNSLQNIYDRSPWVRGSNRIHFEYMGKHYSFGRKLEEKDARLLFGVITKRINQYLRNKD